MDTKLLICVLSSHSPDLVRNVSNAVAIEMRGRWNQRLRYRTEDASQGLSCFGPTANLLRHPLLGGNMVRLDSDALCEGIW